MKNYYRILNVRTNATEAEIKNSYRTLAKRYHPDVNPNNTEAAQRFADINEAHTVLTDPQARKQYDAQLWEAMNPQRRQTTAQQSSYRAQQTQTQAAQAQAQAQMQAQIRAQIANEVAAQLNGVRDRAYKEGYARGMQDGKTQASQSYAAQTEQAQRAVNEFRRNRGELEQELFDRDRELAQANDRVRTLETQLKWLKSATGDTVRPTEMMRGQIDAAKLRVAELKKQLSAVEQSDIKTNPSQAQATPRRIKELSDALNKEFAALNTRIDELSDRVSNVCEQYNQYKASMQDDGMLSAMERRATAWANKQAEDAQFSKPTHYGTLGLLVWATPAQIDEEFARLENRYQGKTDGESLVRFRRIKDAYAVLADPSRRRAYNATLGIDDARIEEERKLIRENEAIQNDYRGKLAAKEFWTRFDELSSLALAGEADAQNLLGEIYYEGNTIDRNYTQAVYWFREAFRQKHPAAIYNLGLCYTNGQGVGRNKSIGTALFRQATNLGYTPPEQN